MKIENKGDNKIDMINLMDHLILMMEINPSTDKVRELQKQLAIKIQTPDHTGATGLQSIAEYAPKRLTDLFKRMMVTPLTNESRELQISVAAALLVQNKRGCTGLHWIASEAPQQLAEMITIIWAHEETPEIKALQHSFCQAMMTPDYFGCNGLQAIARYAPLQLTTLIETARAKPATFKSKALQCGLTKAIERSGKYRYLNIIMKILEKIKSVYDGIEGAAHRDSFESVIKRIYIKGVTIERYNDQRSFLIDALKKFSSQGLCILPAGRLNAALKELIRQMETPPLEAFDEAIIISQLNDPILKAMRKAIDAQEDLEAKRAMIEAKDNYATAPPDDKIHMVKQFIETLPNRSTNTAVFSHRFFAISPTNLANKSIKDMFVEKLPRQIQCQLFTYDARHLQSPDRLLDSYCS